VTVWESGRDFDITAGGYRAIDSLRLEKGYRVWGSDITPEVTPYQAGLDFAVKLERGADFIGREALLAMRDRAPESKLSCVLLGDARSVALGEEPVRCDGRIVGRVTSGGFGYTIRRSIAYAYLPAAEAISGRPVEVEIFGRWVPGAVTDEPLFDPAGDRIRA
jgi:4-methylaminobutanoate oxidase (formaldehyde-forming)